MSSSITKRTAREEYIAILQKAKADHRVTAFLLTGSRAMGLENEYSDYDFEIIVDDAFIDAATEWEIHLEKTSRTILDIDGRVMTVAQLDRAAAWKSANSWNRYALSRAKIEFDRSGSIQQILDDKGSIPLSQRADFVNTSLDHVINQMYRSVKCLRAGDILASRIESAEMINPLLDAAFALHDGRIRPYPKYLVGELRRLPLDHLAISTEDFLDLIQQVLTTGDYRAQQRIVLALETLARSCGHGEIFDSWKGKDRWAMTVCL